MTERGCVMTRRSAVIMTRAAAALVLAVLVALAGCGVPSSSSPTEVGPAPAAGDPVTQSGAVELPDRDGATNALELAKRFFQAGAAADWDPDREVDTRIQAAQNHAQQFLEPELRKRWQPGNVILVADAQFTESLDFVTVSLAPVGVLEANGVLRPWREGEAQPMQMRFQAVTVNGTLLLSSPDGTLPNNVTLSLDGLRTLFEERAVYFWDITGSYLVPDRRYVNRGMSDEKRIRAIIKQCLLGPSDFLKNVVAPQTRTSTLDNPSLDGDRVTVNLPPGGQEPNQNDALRRIAAQIRWSVHRGSWSPDVEIQVNGRKQYEDTGTDFLEFNPSQPRAGQGPPDERRLFAVLEGRVVAVSRLAASPSILSKPENSNVVLAAVHRSNNAAALVRQASNGNLELWLGRNAAEPAYIRVVFTGARSMSRPSFMPGAKGRLLIAVDGTLYDVATDGQAQAVKVPSQPGPVTAVSVAPDGARVALITGGKAVVAPLDSTAALASLGEPRELYTPGVPEAHGIGWLYDDRVVVGGASAMVEVAIDNGRFDPFAPTNLAGSQLTQVSAVPGNPFDGTRGSVVVDAVPPTPAAAVPLAYYAYSTGLVPIVPLGTPSPAPSASAGAGTAEPTKMSAPFYLDEAK
jgi:hypothetical protein